MAETNHSCCRTGASCESSEPASRPPAHASCPECGSPADRVHPITLEHLVRPEARPRVDSKASWYFCRSRTCDVVYFQLDGDGRFLRSDLSVRVGVKETEDPIPLCYCFGHTRASVEEEIVATGRTTVIESISEEIRAGRCACEVKNPSGRCCLPEVKVAVKQLQADAARAGN